MLPNFELRRFKVFINNWNILDEIIAKTRQYQLRASGTDTPRKLRAVFPFYLYVSISGIILCARGDSLVRYRRPKGRDCDFSSHGWSLTRCIRNNGSRQADSRIFMN